MDSVKVGIIGCGNISTAYLKFASQFPMLEVVACADLEPQRAAAQAEAFNVPRACGVDELLADPSIELVLNLTIPAAHVEIGIKALQAGKHVFSEKPLAISTEEGQRLLNAGRDNGRRVGCAPDTFLGTSHQTCRALIDEGAIGRPVAATAQMMTPGHERWHPSPEFYYAPGGGPMFDMGPYYLTAMANLLGPMKRVSGMAGIQISERTIGSGEKQGKKIDVQVPDHVAGHIEYQSGAIGTIVTSFACAGRTDDPKHPITIFGTEGALAVPDPNGFEGDIRLFQRSTNDWLDVPVRHTHPNGRSLGLAEMCHAIRAERPHRASGELAYGVLAAMEGFLTSSERGEHVTIDAPNERPPMLDEGLGDDGVLEPTTARG